MRVKLPTSVKLPGRGLLPGRGRAGLVGLEIEAGSVAAAEVSVNGTVAVTGAAVAPLPPGTFHEGEVVDPERLAEALKVLFSRGRLSKRVRLGVGNQGVVVRTVRLPAIADPKEMDAAVRFQAQEQIPMPLDQAVLDHRIVGGVPGEEGSAPQVDVLVVAARRDMVSSFLEPLRRAGLHPVGIDLTAFGMIRALAPAAPPPGAGEPPTGATLYCGLGDVANLAMARGRSCLFTRVSGAGLEPVVTELGASLGLVPEHASLWLSHVGLARPVEEVDGDPVLVAGVREALERGAAALVDELRLSLDYYGSQEGAVPVERVVLCGPGSAVPGLAERVGAALGLPAAPARPGPLARHDAASAARLTLPFGLALES